MAVARTALSGWSRVFSASWSTFRRVFFFFFFVFLVLHWNRIWGKCGGKSQLCVVTSKQIKRRLQPTKAERGVKAAVFLATTKSCANLAFDVPLRVRLTVRWYLNSTTRLQLHWTWILLPFSRRRRKTLKVQFSACRKGTFLPMSKVRWTYKGLGERWREREKTNVFRAPCGSASIGNGQRRRFVSGGSNEEIFHAWWLSRSNKAL